MPATNYSLSGARDRFSNGSTAIDLAGGAAAAGSGAGAGSAGLASAGSGVGIGAEGPPANRHNSPPPTASNNASISSSPPPTVCRSEEHTSELQSLMRISYAVFCLKKKNKTNQ